MNRKIVGSMVAAAALAVWIVPALAGPMVVNKGPFELSPSEGPADEDVSIHIEGDQCYEIPIPVAGAPESSGPEQSAKGPLPIFNNVHWQFISLEGTDTVLHSGDLTPSASDAMPPGAWSHDFTINVPVGLYQGTAICEHVDDLNSSGPVAAGTEPPQCQTVTARRPTRT